MRIDQCQMAEATAMSLEVQMKKYFIWNGQFEGGERCIYRELKFQQSLLQQAGTQVSPL